MSKDANIFRQSLCTNCTSTGMCISIWILYGYGYAAKDRLLIFSWANQQILERTLTSPMIPKQSEAARLQRLQTWTCLCNTWWHILPSVAKKASTTSTAKSTRLQGKVIHCPPVGFPNPLEDQSLNWNPATGWSSSARFHWAYSILRYSK